MSDSDDLPSVPMEHGLRVDILDNEGIWNTGKIVDVSRDEEDMVEIKYDGWGDEYNEWIPLSSQRLAPLHMFTMVKKCWAKLTKWPWWPAFVVLRAPTRKSAADALNAESKVYIEFFDSYNEVKRSRCWMQKKNIASFQEGFDERASKNIGKNFPAYVDGTQRAMAGRSPVLFSGNGTLPIEFSSRYAKPLADAKLELASGDEAKWFEAYRIFSAHYRVLYGYDFAKDASGTMLAAKNAKGKRANGKALEGGDQGEEDDDDDEVEIIESKGTPVKRGRGRPPVGKNPKKQLPASDVDDDMDGDEEKEAADGDYEDAGNAEEDEEEDDDDADEESESPRGRRSARTTKRKPVQDEEELPRRNTRPRRAKEDDGVSDEADDDKEGEDFTHYECYDDHEAELDQLSPPPHHGRGQSSSRSVSPETVRLPRTKFHAKAHKRTALAQLLGSTKPQPVLKKVKPVAASSRPSKSEIPKSLMKELEAVISPSASGELTLKPASAGTSATKSRRKPAQPQSLSSSPTISEQAKRPAEDAGKGAFIKHDSPSLRHWLGFGAADEGLPTSGTSRKPWSIQSWLISGFRRKQTSDRMTSDN